MMENIVIVPTISWHLY